MSLVTRSLVDSRAEVTCFVTCRGHVLGHGQRSRADVTRSCAVVVLVASSRLSSLFFAASPAFFCRFASGFPFLCRFAKRSVQTAEGLATLSASTVQGGGGWRMRKRAPPVDNVYCRLITCDVAGDARGSDPIAHQHPRRPPQCPRPGRLRLERCHVTWSRATIALRDARAP